MTSTVDPVRMLAVTLPARPRLPPWVHVMDLGDGRLQLRSTRSVLTLKTPELTETFTRLRDHLDGSLSVEELRERGGERALYVKLLLKIMRSQGFLQEAAPPAGLEPGEIARFDRELTVLGQLGGEPLSVLAQLRTSTVLLFGDGALAEAVRGALSGCGALVTPVSEVAECDLLIGCFDGRSLADARKVNAECVEAGVRFLPLLVEGPSASMGPTVIPRETACLECLERRRASTQAAPDEWTRYRRELESCAEDAAMLSPLREILAGQVALEAVRLLTSVAAPATVGTLIEFSVESPLAAQHTVLKVPRCETCGRRVPAPEPWDVKLAPLDPRG